MVEMQQGKKTGIGARVASESARIEGFKNFAHKPRGQATGPFVEIAHDDSGAATLATVQHLIAEQLASRMAALDETGAEVNIKEVQNGTVREQQIAAQTAATLATAPADVVIAAKPDRKATERHVAISAAAQRAVFTKAALVAGEFGVDAARLVPFGLATSRVQDFLKGDDIRIEFGKNGS